MDLEIPPLSSNRGRKKGRKKAASTMDDALYANLHRDATWLVHECYHRLSQVHANPEDRDTLEQERVDFWKAYLGGKLWESIMLKDHALFEGISRILREFPPAMNGDWNPVDPLRAEAASIADWQRAGKLEALTRKQVEERLLPYMPPHGDKRRTISRIIKAANIQVVPAKSGAPSKPKAPK